MMISANVICDSVNVCGNRLTTFVCKYPRFIHSEVLTHRDKSRNSASSRAIPVHKMLWAVLTEMAEPVYWGMNQKGMQANAELPKHKAWIAKHIWKLSGIIMVCFAWLMSKLGVHKQITNRLIEPWSHMTVVISGTEWGNFFNLRAHPDAQPEFQELAYTMLKAYVESKPKLLQPGEWHLPFTDKYDKNEWSIEDRLKICTARCARTSYLTFDGDFSPSKDFKLHDDLSESGHWSPFEHAAVAWPTPIRSGNFIGFAQYRKAFLTENRPDFNPVQLLANRKKTNENPVA